MASDQLLSPQEIDAIASRVGRWTDLKGDGQEAAELCVPVTVEERDRLCAMARCTVEAEIDLVVEGMRTLGADMSLDMTEAALDAAQSAIRAFLAQWDSPGGFVMADDADELAALRAIVAEPTA